MSGRTSLAGSQLRQVAVCGLFVLLVTLMPTTAIGESESTRSTAALAEAERAYQEIDYDAVYKAGQRGLAAGQSTVAETARLNVLAGIAAALLGRDEESRTHFMVALAVEPSLDLEKDLSPRIRGPYLEALGFWRARQDRLSLDVKLDSTTNRLRFRVSDPTHLSTRVLLFVRHPATAAFDQSSVESKPRGFWQLEAGPVRRGFEYYAELVDQRGNRLFTLGTEDDPRVVREAEPSGAPLRDRSVVSERSTATSERSWLLPIATLTAGAAFVGVGAIFSVRREQAAARWNGSECERPGMSRIQQCGDVDAERARMQWLAVGAYSAASALTIVGTTMLLWPSRSAQSSTGSVASCALGLASVRCGGDF